MQSNVLVAIAFVGFWKCLGFAHQMRTMPHFEPEKFKAIKRNAVIMSSYCWGKFPLMGY
jgi:hypothetical protein